MYVNPEICIGLEQYFTYTVLKFLNHFIVDHTECANLRLITIEFLYYNNCMEMYCLFNVMISTCFRGGNYMDAVPQPQPTNVYNPAGLYIQLGIVFALDYYGR